MNRRSQKLMEKIRESLSSVLPITAIVLVLCFTIAPVPSGILMAFVIGAAMLIVGMGLFTLGAEMAMTPMGEHVGARLTGSRRLWLVIVGCFVIGLMITVAEPDLQVLAAQVPSVPDMVLILAVAVGVGLFLVVALLRMLIGIRLSWLLIGFYVLAFVLAAFVPRDFLTVAFDSGGVTTGPMTVPFIMALGVGVSAVRSDRHAENDSFGLVALCSIGPILAVLILGLAYQPSGTQSAAAALPELADSRALAVLFAQTLPDYLREVAVSLAPIAVFFLVFQLLLLRLPRRQLVRLAVGVLYTYLGLVLFLTGVNAGFMPAGQYLGGQMGTLSYRWILVPVGMVIGYFIVAAEPAVHVLNRQVEEITDGAIPPRLMQLSLSIGVAISLGLSMIRVLTGISILWFLLPGYTLAIVLSFFTPKIFTSIAFDSGGVASGPMTATFLLPFAMGACEAVGGNIITDAFGIVAMVAMTPLITIQLLGVLYKKRQPEMEALPEAAEEEIIEL